jgi:3-methylfumaryl-CoA hydratase
LLSPLGHWLHFIPQVRHSLIGSDGHPQRSGGGLLPAVELPQRMWAGSRIRFLRDIKIGSPIVRQSTVTAADSKVGRSGQLFFVTLRHEIAEEGDAPAIIEEQDIVFREAASPSAPSVRATQTTETAGMVIREFVPDSVMLFRFSALTFNAHRIHYDIDYSRGVESYPGLVVQGPLMATLLLDHLLQLRPGAAIASYTFKAVSPAFAGEPLRLGMKATAGGASLVAISPAGPSVTAEARCVD